MIPVLSWLPHQLAAEFYRQIKSWEIKTEALLRVPTRQEKAKCSTPFAIMYYVKPEKLIGKAIMFKMSLKTINKALLYFIPELCGMTTSH